MSDLPATAATSSPTACEVCGIPVPEDIREKTKPPTTAPQSGEVCANCGAAVSASQAKLSQLFQSKTLCKSCMEAP